MAGHGGKRAGAGKKKGSKTRRSVILSEQKAVRVLQGDLVPMDVMMDVMRFYDAETKKLRVEIDKRLPTPETSILQVDRVGPVKRYLEGLGVLFDCAVKTASYVHPHMASADPPAKNNLRDLSKLTDKELDDLERITRKISNSYGSTE